ncbi:MAG: hypothetical protein MUP63_01375 [Candidatus Nanohaloarchaeota archaeon QJJ-7]|nr:hypothetical protein [Candidatus Nanohaloarchaeota archaeon QJJ-7]
MSILQKVQALMIGLSVGSPLGYLQGRAVIDLFQMLENSPVSGIAGTAYSALETAIATYGIWAYIGASSIKGLLLFLIVPAETVTPLYVLEVADSPLDVLIIAIIGAATITAFNFVIYLISRLAGERLISDRNSKKWRFLDWIVVEHGRLSMYFLRIVPWIGGWAAVPAGIARLNIRTFAIYSFLGFLTYESFLGFVAYYGLKAGSSPGLMALLPGLF